MLGAFRGMPTRLAIVLALASVSACSQDPQFVEKDMTPVLSGSGDITVDPCSAGAATQDGIKLQENCFALKSQLAIEPASAELKVGESAQFAAYLVMPDGRKTDVTADAVWAVADSALLVSGRIKGVVKSLAAGASGVQATYLKATASADIKIIAENVPKFPRVAVRIQNSDVDAITVPVGIETLVSWESTDVDSCQLMVRETEYDRRATGSVMVKIQDAGQVEVVCKVGDGTEVKDHVDIVVTRPKVNLTVNGTKDPVIVDGAGPINIAWSSTDASACDIFASGSKISGTSAASGAVTKSVNRSVVVEALCHDSAGNTDRATVDVTLEYQRKISFSPGYFDKISGSKTRRPVSIMFALDVTGSMSGQIQTVKTGVQDFVTQLSSKGFEPRIGVIPFRDSVPEPGPSTDVPEGSLALTDNIEAVKTFVNGLKASNGGDANEASLGAIRVAMNTLRAQETRPDAVKIIMLVTDQPGHTGTLLDCGITPLVNQFAGLTADEQKNFKLFYSTPTIGATCSGFASATQQMTTLLSKILTVEENVANRGGLIPWPFANTNLVNDVVSLLERVNPDIDLACLNTKATLAIDGSVQFIEGLTDLSGALRQLEAGENQSIAKTLTAEQFEALNSGLGSLTVRQCCFSKAAAKAGRFDTCLKPATDVETPFAME